MLDLGSGPKLGPLEKASDAVWYFILGLQEVHFPVS